MRLSGLKAPFTASKLSGFIPALRGSPLVTMVVSWKKPALIPRKYSINDCFCHLFMVK